MTRASRSIVLVADECNVIFWTPAIIVNNTINRVLTRVWSLVMCSFSADSNPKLWWTGKLHSNVYRQGEPSHFPLHSTPPGGFWMPLDKTVQVWRAQQQIPYSQTEYVWTQFLYASKSCLTEMLFPELRCCSVCSVFSVYSLFVLSGRVSDEWRGFLQIHLCMGHAVGFWLKHYATRREVAGRDPMRWIF
jgi:hypothetical protein